MDLQFSGDWFSNNIPVWSDILARFRGQPDICALEIGTFEGRSACWLLQNILTHPQSRLTCIDPFARPEQEDLDLLDTVKFPLSSMIVPSESVFQQNISAIDAQDRVKILRGTSRMMIPFLSEDQFHIIHIDGSHLARAVLADAIGCWSLLKKDGLLIFDDYLLEMYANPFDNPHVGIDAFLSVYGHLLTIEHQEYQVIVRKH